jgi:hypothetical protein
MKCTVCNHPQCHDIDLALLSRSHTLESLSRQYGPSVSALHRHRNHVKEKMIQARERLQRSQAQVSLLKLNAFLDHVQRGVEAAAADGDIDRVFKGSHIGSRLIHQINNLEVPLELDTVYRLISSPGFISQDSLLPTGPRIITDLHQAVLDTATAPCPDPPPELSVEAEDQTAFDDAREETAAALNAFSATENPKTENDPLTNPSSLIPDPGLSDPWTLTTDHCLLKLEALSLLQKHFPDLDFSAADIPRSSDTAPKTLREISAKLARN